jgi:hypothetical protein
MQTRWLFRITYLYLTLPFMIFCMGWLRLPIAIPVTTLVLWALWRLFKQVSSSQFPIPREVSRLPIYLLLITGIWVFLSGVGGYAFQNWDHHWRNAVLRDLITYDWPVVYSAPDRGPLKMLAYYVGYWLPSALVGKAFGWKAANFFLFLWTWLGVFLVTLHLSLKLKASLIKVAFLLILFSGMDALGPLLFASDYPTLWPPIQHLEIWAGNLQYSSFTTQLFWVFNQAVPAWLCIVLILDNNVVARAEFSRPKQSPTQEEIASDEEQEHPRNDMRLVIWALCFFFAPLPSIGLLPYLLIEWFKKVNIKTLIKNVHFDLLFASALIVIISYLFFSSNTAAQEREFQSLAIKDFLTFFLLEGGILWLLLVPQFWRDPRWAVTGVLLFAMPFIQFGSGRDFVMRASIAPLFYLMLMVGETIFQKTTNRILLFTFYFLLLFSSLTPLYEINRSVYRSYQYYFIPNESDCGCEAKSSEPVTHLEQGVAPEAEHPGLLVADEIGTLEFMNDKLSRNFIANVRQSLYYRYLSPR